MSEETRAALDELAGIVRAGLDRAGRDGALMLTRAENARYTELMQCEDVVTHLAFHDEMVRLMGRLLPQPGHEPHVRGDAAAAREAAYRHRIAQAQEVLNVLERHGVEVVVPPLRRLRCRHCGSMWPPKIRPLPGLTAAEMKIRPGAGQLPFTGWRCPSGCSVPRMDAG
jgi:hypothetical protein